ITLIVIFEGGTALLESGVKSVELQPQPTPIVVRAVAEKLRDSELVGGAEYPCADSVARSGVPVKGEIRNQPFARPQIQCHARGPAADIERLLVEAPRRRRIRE